MRKTKIVCTIGPASEDVEVLKKLLASGMNVARLNFSHGVHEEHGLRIENIKQASRETNIPVAIMLDTKGPEIRIGLLEKDQIELIEGEKITLTTTEILGNKERIFVNYSGLPNDVSLGDILLLDDGLISLKVLEIDATEILCEVVNGGLLSNRKKLNLPGVQLNLPGLTERDYADIAFGVKAGIDFIAASFIRNAADVIAIRKILEELDSQAAIIAKIENRQGVDNIAEILQVADGIMIARGDLGVEIPAEEVPLVQKRLIKESNQAGKPVITATQMLDSMSRNPRPTRAEASDVANAILDGSDAIMLSAETATGKFPVEAVKTMARIAKRTEDSLNGGLFRHIRNVNVGQNTTEAISYATCSTAATLGATAIISASKTGSTARMVAKYRPQAPIIATTPDEKVARRLLLVWGVYPLIVDESNNSDRLFAKSVDIAKENGYIKEGDLVVFTAGLPLGIPGSTNMLKVHTVGEILAKGTGIGKQSVSGKAVIVESAAEALEKMAPGNILITKSLKAELVPALKDAAALLTEEGGLTSPGAIVGINLGLPVIVGVQDFTKLTDGEIITVDPVRGLVYKGHARVL
ncbi:MAG: pyruvate kinase [Peptococcia bacterium]